MDQFRGYTVAGMFVVNFLGDLTAVHPVFKHNNTYFSYADSIMPSFLFAVGFSYRLTMLRRLPELGRWGAWRRAIVRSLALVGLSLVLFGFNEAFKSWSAMTWEGCREFVARLLKANLWEVLAIIGVCQLLILPVVAARPWVRILTMVVFMACHVVLSWSFNHEFVYGRPNWLDRYWGAADTRAWDGGFFGTLMWAVPMLAGTLAYDIVAAAPGGIRPMCRLVGWGAVLMVLGYLLSCLSTLYDVKTLPESGPPSAVLPALEQLRSRPWPSLLADRPFVEPPGPEVRQVNYWMMVKRVVTVTFTLFSTGCALALYGLFVLACDRWGWQVDLFRMLGQNPLAAYILHHPVEKTVHAVVPKDSPLFWCLIGLVVFFWITMALVRYLDRHKIYLRL
jgi:predicted acyltransferase